MTVQWLLKPQVPAQQSVSGTVVENDLRLLSCTGERMADLILRLYAKYGMRTTSLEPQHLKGLSNEFRCYANFGCKSWELT